VMELTPMAESPENEWINDGPPCSGGLLLQFHP
jgi:hypothetical protein